MSVRWEPCLCVLLVAACRTMLNPAFARLPGFWLSGTVLFVPTLSALSGVLLCRTDSFGDSIDACWASPAHTVLLIVAVLVVVALCVVLATSAGKSVVRPCNPLSGLLAPRLSLPQSHTVYLCG